MIPTPTETTLLNALRIVEREDAYVADESHRKFMGHKTWIPIDIEEWAILSVAIRSLAPSEAGRTQKGIPMKVTDEMVNRFLGWKLPEDFHPDAGISFKAEFNEHTAHPMKHQPTGTNLFNFEQAKAMLEYVLSAEAGRTQEAVATQTPPFRAALEQAVQDIIEVADYLNDACNNQGEILGSSCVDPLMGVHGDLLKLLENEQQWHDGHRPDCAGINEAEGRCGCGYLQGTAYRALMALAHPPSAQKEREEDHPTDELVERLRQWMPAYPLDLWPEIDPAEWKVIDKVLADAGAPSLSRIAASNMRYVVTKLGEYLPPASPEPVANALQAEDGRDAARYRWLRSASAPNNRWPHVTQYPWNAAIDRSKQKPPQIWDIEGYHPDRLDAAIDIAMNLITPEGQ